MVKILIGDCREVLKTLDAESIDACVTDPPYGLKFMGKAWDYDVPGTDVWQEVYRVLKPGAHLLSFFGTRTYHRGVARIEDAGFEIRDMIAWVYGCLSEDTELLINGKWERYHRAIDKGRALCYIPEHDEYQWQPIQDFVVYNYDDTAFRIVSDSTDQIVSWNHRCIIEQNGKYEFALAETLQCQESVPILESLPDLLRDLSVYNKRASSPESVLLTGVCTEKSRQKETIIGTQGTDNEMYGLRKKSLEAGCMVAEDQNIYMQQKMQRQIEGCGMGETCIQRTGCMVAGIRSEFSEMHDRSKQSSMERRNNVFPKARKLQTDQICPMSFGVYADGEKRWLYNGTSFICGTGNGAVSSEKRSSASSESRSAGQYINQSGSVHVESGSQTIRGSRYTRTTLAQIEPIHYKGKVWCIRVPSGAFVARRNGKVFITGNSGFPKSLDVSKAIDKAAGEEREVVGSDEVWKRRVGKNHGESTYTSKCHGSIGPHGGEITLPATEAAKQWDGWGTALKPALEPLVLARKPLEGTVAENVQRYGTGGINVDGCRVETEEDTRRNAAGGNNGMNGTSTFKIRERKADEKQKSTGRWPANLIHDGSEEVTRLFPEMAGGGLPRGAGNNAISNVYSEYKIGKSVVGHLDSGSAARFFYCAKASSVERDGSKHPTVKPLSLMMYLCRLVTPLGGTILDPFAGTGTTGEAAEAEGFNSILIELDEANIKDLKKRTAQRGLFAPEGGET